jgi:hypothetical protein
MNQNNVDHPNSGSEDLVKSFRLMWDGFPHPVLLLRKNRMIVDSNKLARDLGVPAGVKCRDISPYPAKCKKNCLADKALASGTTERTISRLGGKLTDTYWIPLHPDHSDLYLHFVVDLPEALIQEQTTNP